MKSSSAVAIGGGIAVVVAIAVVMATMSGVSDSPELSENPVDDINEISAPVQSSKIQVLASFYPYYEFTKNVAGDYATVVQYMPSGVEAHDWEPRPQEIQALQDADVFVYNGLGIEPYVDNMISSGEFDNVLFVKASEGIELINPGEIHDTHAEDFAKEIEHVIEEFEHGHIETSQTLVEIEEILHEHEGDGHDHGNQTIEKIEEILHEIDDGHMGAEEGIEEIHHIILDIEEEHHGADEDEHHGADEDEEHHETEEEERHGADEEEEDEHHGHAHDYEFDPHVWLDPILVKHQVNNIRDGLIQADPSNKEHYEQNAMMYNEELDKLDMEIKSSLASCHKDTFVPFHNAFAYFAERYDIKVMSISGLAPDSEATATELAEFVDFVRDNDIKIIFAEELVDPRLAEVIADEAGAQVVLLSPLEALAPDEIGQNVSYIDKMKQNIGSLKIALECQ